MQHAHNSAPEPHAPMHGAGAMKSNTNFVELGIVVHVNEHSLHCITNPHWLLMVS